MKKCAHICVLNRNIGDNALNLAIRNLFLDHFQFEHIELLRNKFEKKTLDNLEKNDIIIFGGGGLIHSFNPNGTWKKTGTMWNINFQDLKKISKPIVLYGVGFNHFFNEPRPINQMKTFFEILNSKNSLISFRNDGSKQRFLSYFPELKNIEIYEIPDPGLFFRITKTQTIEKYVLINIAADRINFRYDNFDKFKEFMNLLLREINLPVKLIPHTPDDMRLYSTLNLSKKLEILPFYNNVKDTSKVVQLYKNSEFTISTRGHSQIISIGNEIPTFQIATHPKVTAFADECNLKDFCYVYNQNTFDEGIAKFKNFLNNINRIRQDLKKLNNEFDNKIKNFNRRVLKI
jgi:polysaccharide pyruvyl transferase WcaK-like protein